MDTLILILPLIKNRLNTKLLNKNELQYLDKAKISTTEFALNGLRALTVAYKYLSEDEFNQFY